MARKQTRSLAQQRIDYLFSLAQRWTDEQRFSDARTAAKHLRALATKHLVSITEYKRRLCKQCDSLLVPGKTCRVRIKNDMRVITCDHCGAVKRLGFST